MKTINLKNTQQLSRSEMREIIAGSTNPSLSTGDATVLCNDGSSHQVSNCDRMDEACKGKKGGAKICSGGN